MTEQSKEKPTAKDKQSKDTADEKSLDEQIIGLQQSHDEKRKEQKRYLREAEVCADAEARSESVLIANALKAGDTATSIDGAIDAIHKALSGKSILALLEQSLRKKTFEEKARQLGMKADTAGTAKAFLENQKLQAEIDDILKKRLQLFRGMISSYLGQSGQGANRQLQKLRKTYIEGGATIPNQAQSPSQEHLRRNGYTELELSCFESRLCGSGFQHCSCEEIVSWMKDNVRSYDKDLHALYQALGTLQTPITPYNPWQDEFSIGDLAGGSSSTPPVPKGPTEQELNQQRTRNMQESLADFNRKTERTR
jgi:hypothetical protein